MRASDAMIANRRLSASAESDKERSARMKKERKAEKKRMKDEEKKAKKERKGKEPDRFYSSSSVGSSSQFGSFAPFSPAEQSQPVYASSRSMSAYRYSCDVSNSSSSCSTSSSSYVAPETQFQQYASPGAQVVFGHPTGSWEQGAPYFVQEQAYQLQPVEQYVLPCPMLAYLTDELLDTIAALLERDLDFVNFRQTCRRVYLATEIQATQRKTHRFRITLLKDPTDVWIKAAMNGDIALLNYLAANHRDSFGPQVIEAALFCREPPPGSSRLSKEFMSTSSSSILSSSSSSMSPVPSEFVAGGKKQKKRKASKSSMIAAKERRDFEVMQWMFSTFPEVFSRSSLNSTYSTQRLAEMAAGRGDLVLLKRLEMLDRYCVLSSEDTLNVAAWNGHHKIVKWIVVKNPNLATARTFSLATMNGQLKVAKVLYMKHSRFRSTVFVESMRYYSEQHGHPEIGAWMRRTKDLEKAAVTGAVTVGTVALGVALCSIQ